MKFIFFAITALLVNSVANAQDESGIKFETGTWAEIVALAAEQNKPIFVDAYTTWCGPCKWMSKNTFTDEKVGEFVNKNFVPYKMDMEKGEGIEFAKLNDVRAYPTLLFFNPKGKGIHRGLGAKNPELFLKLCQNALDPEKQLLTYQKKFAAGEENKEFLVEYIAVAEEAGESTKDAFNKYWTLLSKTEKITADNLELMRSISNGFKDLNDDLFVFMKKNKKGFIATMGEEKFKPYWTQAYNSAVWYTAMEKTDKDRKKKLKTVKSTFKEYKKEADAFLDMNVAWQSKNEEIIKKATAAYVEVTSDWQFLNSNAWSVYENSTSNEELEKALTWIVRSVDIDANYFNLDTKGAILFKLKKFEEAKIALEAALESTTEFIAEEDLNTTKKMLTETQEMMTKE